MDNLTPDELERINIASQSFARNQVVLSDHHAMPIFCWSARALKGPEVQAAIEAEGNNPYEFLAGWPMPAAMALQIVGRPRELAFCWLCIVKIKANPQSFQK